jgi:NAD(P)-dependent dehydrogenase (short-subunit alcohol dehydrogenase family)
VTGAALVTGASSGIGAATCRALREAGWSVFGLARGESPDATVALRGDVARYEDVRAAFEQAAGVTLVVHSAATVGPLTPLQESDPDEWRRAVDVNLLGTYNVLRAALAADVALFVHLTTGAASRAKPHWSAYSASKAGAEHLMRSAAADVEGSGRGVCALDPGITATRMQEQIRASDFPGVERFVQVHREGTSRSAEEVAEAVLELTRRDPASLNGETLRVGWL